MQRCGKMGSKTIGSYGRFAMKYLWRSFLLTSRFRPSQQLATP